MMHSRLKTTEARRPELEPALARGSVELGRGEWCAVVRVVTRYVEVRGTTVSSCPLIG